jgi:HPt (histidine-containing phosphotransfer) domain-containing protein
MILRLTRAHRHDAVAGPAAASQPAASPSSAEHPPGLALDRALGIWKDAAIYRRYLRRFTQEYSDVVTRIRAASAEEAERLAHKLKAAAGNLGIDQVADCAAKLEQVSAIPEATEQLETATADLQVALETALTSIADYAAESPAVAPLAVAPEAITHAQERPDLAPLIRAAANAFRDFDPIGAEEPLSQLARHLPVEQLTALQDAIEQLDATAGDAVLRELANRLHIDLEDGP